MPPIVTPSPLRHHRRLQVIADKLAWRRRFFFGVGGLCMAHGALVAAGGLPGQAPAQGTILAVAGAAIAGFGWWAGRLDASWWSQTLQRQDQRRHAPAPSGENDT